MPAILFDVDAPCSTRAGVRMLFDGPADLLAHLDRSPFDDRC